MPFVTLVSAATQTGATLVRVFTPKQNQLRRAIPSSFPRTSKATPSLGLYEHPILALQHTMGNQALLRLLQTHSEKPNTSNASPQFGNGVSQVAIHPSTAGVIQRKLTINKPGDEYEQEADRVSEEVVRLPEQERQGGCSDNYFRGRHEQLADRWLEMKRVPDGGTGQIADPFLVHEVLKSSGQPLDPATRRLMEPRFGHNFSKVRVHTGREAAESCRTVGATAYTVGQNVVFGNRQYAPQTADGQRLLAHELAHVVQQGAARPRAECVRNLPGSGPDVDEHPADGIDSVKGSRGSGTGIARTVSLNRGGAGLMLQRQVADPRALVTDTIKTPRQFKISQWLVEPAPGGGTSREELYWVDFEVDSKGLMKASVRTVLPDRKYRSGLLRFGDSFRNALQHFDANGVEVNAFEGDWSYMTKDEISDNLRVFREEMEKGGTREAAAQKTPTAKVVKPSGFELTSVENVPESQEHLAEQGVRRWRVKALFRRQVPVQKPGPPGGAPAVTSSGGTPTSVKPTGDPTTASKGLRFRVRSIGMGGLQIGAGAGIAFLLSFAQAEGMKMIQEPVIEKAWKEKIMPQVEKALEQFFREEGDLAYWTDWALHSKPLGKFYVHVMVHFKEMMQTTAVEGKAATITTFAGMDFIGISVGTDPHDSTSPYKDPKESHILAQGTKEVVMTSLPLVDMADLVRQEVLEIQGDLSRISVEWARLSGLAQPTLVEAASRLTAAGVHIAYRQQKPAGERLREALQALATVPASSAVKDQRLKSVAGQIDTLKERLTQVVQLFK